MYKVLNLYLVFVIMNFVDLSIYFVDVSSSIHKRTKKSVGKLNFAKQLYLALLVIIVIN